MSEREREREMMCCLEVKNGGESVYFTFKSNQQIQFCCRLSEHVATNSMQVTQIRLCFGYLGSVWGRPTEEEMEKVEDELLFDSNAQKGGDEEIWASISLNKSLTRHLFHALWVLLFWQRIHAVSPVYSSQSSPCQTRQPAGCSPERLQTRTWPSRPTGSSSPAAVCSNARKRAIHRTDSAPDHLQSQTNPPRDIPHFQGRCQDRRLSYFPPTWHIC